MGCLGEPRREPRRTVVNTIHRTGERHTHTIALLEEILQERSDIKHTRLYYNVAYKFDNAQKALLPENNITPRIGWFHLLSHGLSCQINYNSIMMPGFGLTVGEELEQLWSYIQHLIQSGRVSSLPRKRQKLDSCLLYLPQRGRKMMGLNLKQWWKRINEIRSDASRELEMIVGWYVSSRTDSNGNFRPGTSISREYLESQHTLQVNYYKTYKYVGTRQT